MTSIEQRYRESIAQWSGQQRVMRVVALFSEFHGVLSHRVRIANPDLDERSVRREVAASLYRTDPELQRLLRLVDG